MIIPVLVIGLAAGPVISWRAARAQARAAARRELARAWADMRREVNHWQEAAARANAEVARVTREAEAFKAGCQSGREDVISIMPLLVAAQQRPADEARASGDER
jgi:predicted  nucleic acid-binding Zn-ribbon protein